MSRLNRMYSEQTNRVANSNSLLQKFAKHQTNVFNSLRQSIKKEGDMFLFGDPTDAMVKLMLKVYHENILRVLSNSKDSDYKAKFKCMFGIMHARDKNGDTKLLCTISESPGVDKTLNSPSDPDYMNKRRMMLNILKSAKVNVNYPEKDSTFQPPVFKDMNRWRKGVLGADLWNSVPDAKKIREKIKANNGETMNVMFYNPDESDNVNIYDKRIRDLEMEVDWVDSYEYLRRRRNHEPTFPPYKKYSEMRSGVWQAECNNGHLCTESKLFAYAKIYGLEPFSFAAYWIGDSAPPEKHIIRKYSYRTMAGKNNVESEVIAEASKLRGVMELCKKALIMKPPLDTLERDPKFDIVLTNAVQPIAIACPGCFANIQAFMRGDMVFWNNSNCYVPRRMAPEGGRRKTRKHKGKKRRMTHKH